MNQTTRQFSPACERNKIPILQVLNTYINPGTRVLEIASGTGQHADFFTKQLTEVIWQPSDIDETALDSIKSYQNDSSSKNFLTPLKLSTTDRAWKIEAFDISLCCNMIHISPWESCLGLFEKLSQVIMPNGFALLYGPFIVEGVETAPSNLEFDASLRNRNPSWGIRHLKKVEQVANSNGFFLQKIHDMPSNNLIVAFAKTSQDPII